MDGGTEVYGTLVSNIQTDVSVTGKPVYLTASGNEITVDVKKGNMTNPVVTMTPIQNLNGYDNPWVGGAGKNKLELTVDEIKRLNSGTWNGNTLMTNGIEFTILTENNNVVGIKVKRVSTGTGTTVFRLANNENDKLSAIDNLSVILNGCPTNILNAYMQFYLYDGTNNQNDIGNGTSAFTTNLVTSSTIRIVVYDTFTDEYIFKPMIRLSTEEDSTFTPYENICPITARTKTDISVNGSIITREYGQEIYGGTDEIAEGVVTNSWVELNITSPDNIRRNNAKQYYIRSTIAFEVNSTNIVSDKFRTANSGSGVCFLNQNGNIRFNTVDEYDSAEDLFNTIGNIKFVAKVQTPHEILTTKGYVPLDKGTNEITVSNNDIITFDYCSTLAGKLNGTLYYIENGLAPSGYLSGSGNFLALHLDSEDWDIYTSVKVGLYPSEGSGMVEILSDEEKICVGKITSNDQVFKVESTDGTLTKTDVYSLEDLVLETE